MKRKLFGRIICLFMIITIILSCNIFVLAKENINYDDVKDYYPYSSWAVDIGIKYGLIFLENNRREVKRWEIVNILYNILQLKEVKKQTKEFTDINETSDSIKKRIYAVSNEGLVSGYNDGTFKPYNNVTRAEFVTMLDRTELLSKKTALNSVTDFKDIQNHWAKESINKISRYGIVTGKGDNMFCPNDSITAQEILVILDRLRNGGSITSNIVVNAMIDTFKCKKYSEEEKYIIEVLYSKFDEVQNDIKYKWFNKELYDPENWQQLATYEDLLVAMYFTKAREHVWYEEGEIGREKIETIKKNILHAQGFDIDKDEYLSHTFTIRNLIKVLRYPGISNESLLETKSDEISYGSERIINKVKFSNINDISIKDQLLVASSCVEYNYLEPIFDNNYMYFPIDAPVTKYMLNYVILKLRNSFYFEQELAGSMFKKYLNTDDYDIETDSTKFPYNYTDYPYIIKGVPKEVYERPFIYSRYNRINTPKECFEHYSKYSKELLETSYNYYDTILNVDYRNINIDDFLYKLHLYGIHRNIFDEEAKKYVQYVIDNKIILKGKGTAIPGTIFIADITAYVRVMVEFEVVSANEKKNLLYGDFSYKLEQDVIYNSDKYTLYFDAPVSGSYYKKDNELKFGMYRMETNAIIKSLYEYDHIYNMP